MKWCGDAGVHCVKQVHQVQRKSKNCRKVQRSWVRQCGAACVCCRGKSGGGWAVAQRVECVQRYSRTEVHNGEVDTYTSRLVRCSEVQQYSATGVVKFYFCRASVEVYTKALIQFSRIRFSSYLINQTIFFCFNSRHKLVSIHVARYLAKTLSRTFCINSSNFSTKSHYFC